MLYVRPSEAALHYFMSDFVLVLFHSIQGLRE